MTTAASRCVRAPVIALLESPMSLELSRLVEKRGGNPQCVPALREVAASSADAARQQLVQGLRQAIVVARGPKPTAALRGFGVPPTLTAREPCTSAELIDALSGLPLEGRRVLSFHYGERGP